MNVRALQRIDRWLGVPLCFALTIIRTLVGGSAWNRSRAPRTWLFVKLAEQGSTVLAYSALRRATDAAGPENVYFLALEENRFIVDVLGLIPERNVFTLSFDNVPALVRSSLSVLRRLRALRLDVAIDLEFFSRGSAALTFLSGASRRVGFDSSFGAGPYRGSLMTHRVLYNPHQHTSDTFLSLVEAATLDPSVLPAFDWRPPPVEEPPPFTPYPEETAHVRKLLGRETGDDARLILLNPNASDRLPLRRWPTERYVELARRLLERYPDVRVAFTGGPEEAVTTGELATRVNHPRAFSLAGKTTLRELLVLFTLADVLVTNDSGPAHFATLTSIRVITLFGPETPALFAARTPRTTVLWAGIACSPCVSAYNNRQSSCRNNLCMQAIGGDEVFAETCQAYERDRSRTTSGGAGGMTA